MTKMTKSADQWFSPVSYTNKPDRQDITEILLKVVLNTINQTNTINKYDYIPKSRTISLLIAKKFISREVQGP